MEKVSVTAMKKLPVDQKMDNFPTEETLLAMREVEFISDL